MRWSRYSLPVAVILAVLAGWLAWSGLRSRSRALSDDWRTIRVACASRDLGPGETLAQDALAICHLPERFAGPSFVSLEEGDARLQALIGQRLQVPLRRGDPLLYSHLSPALAPDLAASVPPGTRAVALDLPEHATVNQWIRPGDHVDVLAAVRGAEESQLTSVTLLENVVVLATGAHSGSSPSADDPRAFRGVVLLTLPEEAERLVLASESGPISLVLRSPDDTGVRPEQPDRTPTDARSILSPERSAALHRTRTRILAPADTRSETRSEPRAAPTRPVDIIRGTTSERQELSDGEIAQ